MSLADQAISGVKWNTVALVFNAALQFAAIAVLARLLDPADFGLMGMAVVVTGFATAFSDFGLSNAIIHRQEATHERLSSLYWFNLAVGWSIFMILWVAIPLAVAYYREPSLSPVLRWSAIKTVRDSVRVDGMWCDQIPESTMKAVQDMVSDSPLLSWFAPCYGDVLECR